MMHILHCMTMMDYYPDDAYITLYDNDGNVLDTKEIYLNTNSGKQTF